MPIYLFLVLGMAMPGQRIQADTPHLSVRAVNQLIDKAFREHDTSSHACYVTGYFDKQRLSMLVADLALLRGNRPVPDNLCVLLRGPGVDSIGKMGLIDRYEKTLVEVYITVKLPPFFPPGMDAYRLEYYIKALPRIIKP